MENVRYAITGVRKLRRNLKKMEKIAKEPIAVMKRIGVWMLKSTNKNFETEGANLGERWTPLSERYEKARKAKGRWGARSNILQVSGKLKRSIVYEVPKSFVLRWGHSTLAPYGNPHQTGSKKKNIPARPFLGFSDEDKNMVMKIAGNELGRLLKARLEK